MKKNPRFKVLVGVLCVLTLVAILVLKNFANPPRPAPNQPNYYTGPRINKARTLIVDDNGKVYGPAPAESPTSIPQPGKQPDEHAASMKTP